MISIGHTDMSLIAVKPERWMFLCTDAIEGFAGDAMLQRAHACSGVIRLR
jgi:hypothetical protein